MKTGACCRAHCVPSTLLGHLRGCNPGAYGPGQHYFFPSSALLCNTAYEDTLGQTTTFMLAQSFLGTHFHCIHTLHAIANYMQNVFLIVIDSVFSQKTQPLMQAKHNRVFAHYRARIHTFNYVEQGTKPITQVQTPDMRVYHV